MSWRKNFFTNYYFLILLVKETFQVESPGGEYTSSSTDNSMEQDGGAEIEQRGGEVKSEYTQEKPNDENETEMTDQEKEEGEISEQSQLGQRSQDQHTRHIQPSNMGSADNVSNKSKGEDTPSQNADVDLAVEQRKAKVINPFSSFLFPLGIVDAVYQMFFSLYKHYGVDFIYKVASLIMVPSINLFYRKCWTRASGLKCMRDSSIWRNQCFSK